MVEKYSISETNLIKLNDYAKSLKIDLISTPFSNKEVDFLVNVIKAPFIKVASMDLNNFHF